MRCRESWVGRIAATDLSALAGRRGLAGWMLCADGAEWFWLSVPIEDEEIFQKLPLLGRWASDAEGRLIRKGCQVPERVLPGDGWMPVCEVISVVPPLRGVPGMPPPAVGFRLELDSADRPAAGLLCRGEVFSAWAEMAFAPRLGCLHFACCDDGRTFVAGLPLPAIPGAGFHRLGRLWLPCGYRLPDHVWPGLLEELLGLGRNRMAILHPDGTHEELDEENLVPATRGSVRSSRHGIPAID